MPARSAPTNRTASGGWAAHRPPALRSAPESTTATGHQPVPATYPTGLNGYERETVGLWARADARLGRREAPAWPARAAAHVLLGRLRSLPDRAALFAHYQAGPVDDFELIHRLLPAAEPLDDVLWQIRDAAFHRRWRELATGDG